MGDPAEEGDDPEEGSYLMSLLSAIVDNGSDGFPPPSATAAGPWDGDWEFPPPLDAGWEGIAAEDILRQESAIREEEAKKMPPVGDKEPLSALAAEYQSGHPILLEKIMMLGEHYASIRRTRGDGNCFFRSFMFSYMEHILGTQDRAEVDHIKTNIEECRKTMQDLGYPGFVIDNFFQC